MCAKVGRVIGHTPIRGKSEKADGICGAVECLRLEL
jgi:hypothetical protein